MDDQDYFSEEDYSFLKLCGEPTVIEGLRFAKDIILANMFFQAIIQYISLPQFIKHNLSLILGSFLLYNSVGFAFLWTAGLTIGSYAMLMILTLLLKKHRGIITSVCVILFLLKSEYLVVNSKMWQQIRGIQMIAAMKVISVAIDLDSGFVLDAPSPAAFAGYIMCPANCVLGPWVSFQKYTQSLEKKYLNRHWVKSIILNMVASLLSLFLSNCFVPWSISADSSKWAVAYRDALSFRTSHYFVSLMSQATMISGGFGEQTDGKWSVHVTKPLHIELPRSLVQVVIYWNIPMHQWLKTYVFKVFQPHGKFIAIFATYSISSLLHGLNFQLSAALLSIGTFSFVEYKLRSKIASIFSVCCLVNPCSKNCGHVNKNNPMMVYGINFMMMLLALFHLTYLGVMFEASFDVQETGYSFSHTLGKWAELNFSSHIVSGVIYFLYFLI